jgi:hypothetical protein
MLPCPLGTEAGCAAVASNPGSAPGAGNAAVGASDGASDGGSETETDGFVEVGSTDRTALRVGWSAGAVRVEGFGAVVTRSGSCAGVAAGGGVSAGLVTVPLRLKFCSSRGPIVSVAGALPVGASGSCAAAGACANAASVAAAAIQMRKPAVIPVPPIAIESRSHRARANP